MLVWSWWRWADRPEDPVTALFGMCFESALFAVVLWQFSRNFGPIVDHFGIKLQVVLRTAPAARVLTYVGAGIYEEVLFRLGLFSVVCFLLRAVALPKAAAVPVAALAAAVTFAAAHHLGPSGEEVVAAKFLFRVAAGLFFTGLYVFRGFGVAVGAHAGYDVLVGVGVG